MTPLLLVVVQHWRVLVVAVVSGAAAFWLGHRVGVASVHCPAPDCPEVHAEASAGDLTGSLGCRVKGWHVVDLDPPSMVAAGPVPVPPKTVTRTVEVLRTVPGAPLPQTPCTDRILVPDLELTATGNVQGPKAEASADPPRVDVVPTSVATPGGRFFPSLHAGGGNLGAELGGGLGYRWSAGNALALEGSVVMSPIPVQSRGWSVRLRYDF